MKILPLAVAFVLSAALITPSYAMSIDAFNKNMKNNSSQLNKISERLSKLSNRLMKSIESKYKKVENNSGDYLDEADAYVKEYIKFIQEAADKAEALVQEFENKQY
jgi:predicted  nucleic acid-binding Zn-ribbon protein